MPDTAHNAVSSPVHVLLAVPEGLLHDALVIYLQTLAGTRITTEAHRLAEILPRPEFSDPPKIVLLDASLTGDQPAGVLGVLRAEYPEVVLIVMVDGPRQQQLSLQAGADFALLKGYLGESLRLALAKAIPDQKAQNPKSS